MLVRLVLGLLLFCTFAPTRSLAQARPTVEIFLLKPTAPKVARSGFFQPTTALLADTAFLTDADLRGYEISGQGKQRQYTLHLTPAGRKKLQQLRAQHLPLEGKPFAVVINGQPLFGAYFWTPISSFSSEWLVVMSWGPLGDMQLSAGAGMLEPHFTPEHPDPREAPQLLEALRQTGRLTQQ